MSSGFASYWWPKQCLAVQHGNGKTPHRDRITGRLPTGDRSLTDAELIANRTDHPADILRHSLDSAWWRERTPVLNRIEVPGIFGREFGAGPECTCEEISRAISAFPSKDKWLSLHTGKHCGVIFTLPQHVAAQKKFFNHFLRDERNGWDEEPRVKNRRTRSAWRKASDRRSISAANDKNDPLLSRHQDKVIGLD